jgi:hypothetical protein
MVPQNDGQLVVRDGDGAPIWSSKDESSSSSASEGWMHQITSGGVPKVRQPPDGVAGPCFAHCPGAAPDNALIAPCHPRPTLGMPHSQVSCIFSGPSPSPAVNLASPSGDFSLRILRQGAMLQLQDASGATVWEPKGAKAGSPPAQLCISTAGRLELKGSGGSSSLWVSSYSVAGKAGPFTAYISDTGCLEVVDRQCNLLYSSTASGKSASGGGSKPLPKGKARLPAPPMLLPRVTNATGAGAAAPRRPPPRKAPKQRAVGTVAGFTKAPKPPTLPTQTAQRPRRPGPASSGKPGPA